MDRRHALSLLCLLSLFLFPRVPSGAGGIPAPHPLEGKNDHHFLTMIVVPFLLQQLFLPSVTWIIAQLLDSSIISANPAPCAFLLWHWRQTTRNHDNLQTHWTQFSLGAVVLTTRTRSSSACCCSVKLNTIQQRIIMQQGVSQSKGQDCCINRQAGRVCSLQLVSLFHCCGLSRIISTTLCCCPLSQEEPSLLCWLWWQQWMSFATKTWCCSFKSSKHTWFWVLRTFKLFEECGGGLCSASCSRRSAVLLHTRRTRPTAKNIMCRTATLLSFVALPKWSSFCGHSGCAVCPRGFFLLTKTNSVLSISLWVASRTTSEFLSTSVEQDQQVAGTCFLTLAPVCVTCSDEGCPWLYLSPPGSKSAPNLSPHGTWCSQSLADFDYPQINFILGIMFLTKLRWGYSIAGATWQWMMCFWTKEAPPQEEI